MDFKRLLYFWVGFFFFFGYCHKYYDCIMDFHLMYFLLYSDWILQLDLQHLGQSNSQLTVSHQEAQYLPLNASKDLILGYLLLCVLKY